MWFRFYRVILPKALYRRNYYNRKFQRDTFQLYAYWMFALEIKIQIREKSECSCWLDAMAVRNYSRAYATYANAEKKTGNIAARKLLIIYAKSIRFLASDIVIIDSRGVIASGMAARCHRNVAIGAADIKGTRPIRVREHHKLSQAACLASSCRCFASPRIGTWRERGDLFAIAAHHFARRAVDTARFLVVNTHLVLSVLQNVASLLIF